MKLTQLLTIVATLGVGEAMAATKYFRDQNFTFNGNAVTVTEWDDAYVVTGSTLRTTNYNDSSLRASSLTTGVSYRSLIGVKDLFSQLPATDGLGGELTVTGAKLHLVSNGSFGSSSGATVTINRVTTNWLSQAAGANDETVTGALAKTSSPTVAWANSFEFGTGDFDAATSGSATYVNGTNLVTSIDITSVVDAMYDSGVNYGFVLSSNSTTTLQSRSSEHFQTASVNYSPVLEITYDYTAAAVPEPTTLGLAAVAGIGLLARRRRQEA